MTEIKKPEIAASTPAPLKSDITRRRTQGYVVDCDGARAVIMAHVDQYAEHMENYWAVGQLVSIHEGANRVVGQTYHVESVDNQWVGSGVNTLLIHIELVGEIRQVDKDEVTFSSGITNYPRMGSIAHRIRAIDLETMYQNDAGSTITVGHLAQETSVPAKIDLDRLISRHFAIVGSTGTGKSTAVTLILHKIIVQRPDLRVLILDPHNEFSTAFLSEAVVQDAKTLTLPFWLFTFEEFREIVFRGQKGFDAETELLRDLIAEAKQRYEGDGRPAGALVSKNLAAGVYTADSPVPYRLADLFALIEDRLGQLEGKTNKPTLKQLRDRLLTISEDPRFALCFSQPNAGGDRMKEIVRDLFRVPHDDKPISVIDTSELPAEVVNSVASVLCRMAFDLAVASQGSIQTLVVCEEAHRYIPANQEAGFWPTRQAVARIAKEGRKYGVHLGIITQRPSELDPTILSQCNTIFAMRLANQNDQEIIGGAMTNGAQTSINFISSLADRECIAFGEALKTPMRMTFETIPAECLPGSRIKQMQQEARRGANVDLATVIRRMRESNVRTSNAPASSVAGQRLAQREIGDEEIEAAVARDMKKYADDPAAEPARPVARVAPSLEGKTVPRANGDRNGHATIEPMGAIHDWAGDKMVGRTRNGSSSEPAASAPGRGNSLVQAFRSRH